MSDADSDADADCEFNINKDINTYNAHRVHSVIGVCFRCFNIRHGHILPPDMAVPFAVFWRWKNVKF